MESDKMKNLLDLDDDMEQNDGKLAISYAKELIQRIMDLINLETMELIEITSGTITTVNVDGTLNVKPMSGDDGIWTGISNQSVYQDLKIGDQVKVIKQNGDASNSWICGVLKANNKKNIKNEIEEKLNELEQQINNINSKNKNFYMNFGTLLRSTDTSYTKNSVSCYQFSYTTIDNVQLTTYCPQTLSITKGTSINNIMGVFKDNSLKYIQYNGTYYSCYS